ncbi:flavodoxin family protein [Oceanirhabdus sp. W0125-5]|uniref:flavodoxin family protein n=1 Tax=Oceanirhabdus sp. W0125-5 TaxID=2999116 RepID=UPI0022F31F05|nr:hypothetical protein [Oceanirhabdus sp. W0125-5]WBW94969.1 hypothetical protein OW730_14840 [Oceanirhabdus sp. W0125-5]
MKSLHTLYFSPTGTTKRTVSAIAEAIGEVLNSYDITLPQNRVTTPVFGKDDLIIIGMPVYA